MGSKLVVRVPMSILFAKFEALYLKRVMESDFGVQNYAKLQKKNTKSSNIAPKMKREAPEIDQK